MLDLIAQGIGLLLLIAVLPGTLYLLILTLASLFPARRPANPPRAGGRIAIVVPAHDEAAGIGRTVDNLRAIIEADGDAEVCVIADNCTDTTAAIAREHGARVLERQNPTQRGKGYALDFAFRTLAGEGFMAYVVVDADTLADANLLEAIREAFAQGADAVQTGYKVLNAGDSPRTLLAELAACAFNCLRTQGRHVLGWSAGLLGNGFALRREVLERVPYTATSVVEDLEYHLRLIEADIHVHFAGQTVVRAETPVASAGQQTQRARWEGGRLRMLLDHGGPLFRRALRGELRFFEPLFDLLLLPLAYHTVLLILLLMVPWTLGRLLAGLGLACLGLHVLVAARVGGMSARQFLLTLVSVPKYVFWKLGMLRSTASAAKKSTHWVRTQRDTHS